MDITEEITQHPNGVEKRKYTRKSPTNKKADKPVKKRKVKATTFLFFLHKGEEYTETIDADKADARALEIFAEKDYQTLEKIYFMKPVKLFKKPIMEVIRL